MSRGLVAWTWSIRAPNSRSFLLNCFTETPSVCMQRRRSFIWTTTTPDCRRTWKTTDRQLSSWHRHCYLLLFFLKFYFHCRPTTLSPRVSTTLARRINLIKIQFNTFLNILIFFSYISWYITFPSITVHARSNFIFLYLRKLIGNLIY